MNLRVAPKPPQARSRSPAPQPVAAPQAGATGVPRYLEAGVGEPLGVPLRQGFERALGLDLADVQVRRAPAAQLASTAGAKALVVGRNIVLSDALPSAVQADRHLGRHFLLAHEAAHLAQIHGASTRTAPRTGGTDPAAEAEADRIALAMTFGLRQVTRPAGRALNGAPLTSPLSDRVDLIWTSTADKAQIFDTLRQSAPVTDPDLDALLLRIFAAGSDDLWLARTIAAHGPEPLWPTAAFDERRQRQRDHAWAPERGRIEGTLMTTAGNRPVHAYFFPGTSDERALVIAGVHGSEQGGIEVVNMLLETLHNALLRPYYTVIVVPTLFPDNAARRRREGSTPTNRNFPSPGTSLDAATPAGGGAPIDAGGRQILPENITLMRLIERFRPSRIASVHGSSARADAGIFSDPHTVSSGARARAVTSNIGNPLGAGLALAGLDARAAARTQEDQDLALSMARSMTAAGFGRGVVGNHLATTPTTGWSGSTPGGTSLGGWAPQDVSEGRASDRPSMTLLTIEVATNVASTDLQGAEAARRSAELASYRDVIQDIFLGPPGAALANTSP